MKNVDLLVVQGEITGPGIQGNIYGLATHQFNIFNIVIDNKRVALNKTCAWKGIDTVPIFPARIIVITSYSIHYTKLYDEIIIVK